MVLFLLVSMLLAAPMAAAADDGTYIVVAGDTLSAIAARHSVRSYMEIVELTNARRATDASYAFIENPNLIHVGWKLAIPGAGVGPVVAPLVAKAQAVDVGVDQTSNMAALGILDLITPPEAALAARPQATIDLIEAQIPAMYNTMVNTLKGLGSYTLFMPVGTAWTRLSDAELQTLAGDEAVRTAAWRHHVVPGTFAANQLLDGTFLTTLDGRTLAVTRVGEQVRIDGLPVVRADIDPPAGVLASKGLVHVLDGMLSPTGVVAPGPAGSYTVVKGDTLFYIAQRLLGEGRRYMEIVELTNKSGGGYAFIENPNLIEIGWMLAIPAR
jgi:nucleoid-associated protein YgaU